MEAYTVGVIVTFYDKFVVLEAFGLTATVTIGLTIYTLQSKRDFSGWAAGLFSCLWVIIIAGFMQMFFHFQVVELGIAIGGAVIFSLFIVVDTSMMMHTLSPGESGPNAQSVSSLCHSDRLSVCLSWCSVSLTLS